VGKGARDTGARGKKKRGDRKRSKPPSRHQNETTLALGKKGERGYIKLK